MMWVPKCARSLRVIAFLIICCVLTGLMLMLYDRDTFSKILKKNIESNLIFSNNSSVNFKLNYTKDSAFSHVRHVPSNLKVSNNVHIFYYPWYGNPQTDGHYFHWNHEYIQHWDKNDAKNYKKGKHIPPNDIGANYYPEIGPYSSRDRQTIDLHMTQIRSAGVGVILVSWYPPGTTDQPEASEPDSLIPILLDTAEKHGLKITLHIEPYKGRNSKTLRKNFEYIIEKYFPHNAFYKHKVGSKIRPFLYIYDSYLIPPLQWQDILHKDGKLSIRGDKKADVTAIGLMVELKHQHDIVTGGFDGLYTYFGSTGFSYGSTWSSWKRLAKYCYQHNLIFIPSVAPGYIDTMVRPWNSKTTKERSNGKYYNLAWQAALHSRAKFISITSFNEWHEGTQIEPAIPKMTSVFQYENYLPNGSEFYLNLTKMWIEKFIQ